MKLYEIDQQLERLIELDTDRMVDPETGEILTDEDIDKLQMDRAAKIEGCMLGYKNKVAEADAIDEEIKKLTVRKKAAAHTAEWLKTYVQNSLAGEEFSTPRAAVKYTKSKSVEVTCSASELPPDWCRVTIAPDKVALKKALEAGEKITGVQLVEKLNMQIK